MEKYYLFSLFIILSFSCRQEGDQSFSLKKDSKEIKFILDSNTKTLINTIQVYQNNEKEYLTFQCYDQNKILFYNFETKQFEFDITPQIDGNNGVGYFHGYYIDNLNNIYLTSADFPEIAVINEECTVINKYNYSSTLKPDDNYRSSTNYYLPIVKINNDLYLVSRCNRLVTPNPVALSLNIQTDSLNLLPFNYPSFPGADNKFKPFSVEEYISRCYNNEKFIYSFYFDENIYIANKKHDSVIKKVAKSEYINEVKVWNDYGQLTVRDIVENPNYGNILYDKYRDVYYRIAYPKISTDIKLRDKELLEILQYGRKKFSIIILDNNFNKIGETMMPEDTYNSQLMFIREDGLYISTSYPMKSDYDDNILGFQKFKLTKE